MAYLESLHLILNNFGPCPKIGLSKNIFHAVLINESCAGVKIYLFDFEESKPILFAGDSMNLYFNSELFNVIKVTVIREITKTHNRNHLYLEIKNIIKTVDKLSSTKAALSPERKIRISIKINKIEIPIISKKLLFGLDTNKAKNKGILWSTQN